MDPVIIVSAYGRSLWLAKALKLKGIEVIYIDQTPFLGPWSLKDQEGPFPFMKYNLNDEDQVQYWKSQNLCTEIDSGFTVLLPSGPLELKSPHLSHRFSRINILPEVIEEIQNQKQISHKKYEGNYLQQVWPLALAHNLSSSVEQSPLQSLQFPHCASLMGPCILGNLYPLRQRLEEFGKLFKVISDSKLEDISFAENKSISGVLLKNERSDLLKCSRVVWSLTALETQFLSVNCAQKIFANKGKEFQRSWMRWSFEIKASYLPDYFIMIQDIEMPWSHENFLCLSKDYMTQQYSVWCLLPSSQRMQKSYLEEYSTIILNCLKTRFCEADVRLISKPIESDLQLKDIGPSLFGVYKEGVFQYKLSRVSKEFYNNAPDEKPLQDPASLLLTEKDIFNQVEQSWFKEVELRQKKEMRNT